MEITSNYRRKKLHKTNQSSNFLRGSFSNRDNVREPIPFRREEERIEKRDSIFADHHHDGD